METAKRLWSFWQDVVIENFCRYSLLIIILLAFIEVVRRYMFGDTFIWYQDVAVYGHMTLIFLYFSVALKSGSHIRLTLALELMQRKGGSWARTAQYIELFAFLLGFVICLVFIWCGIDFVKTGYDFGRTTESADLLVWPFYVLLIVGFVSLAVEMAITFFTRLKQFSR